jgi:hypothetical protein
LKLLDDHKAGAADNSRKIWIVYAFLEWYRIFFIDGTVPEAPPLSRPASQGEAGRTRVLRARG